MDRVKYEPVKDEDATPDKRGFEDVHLGDAALGTAKAGWKKHLRLAAEIVMMLVIVLLLVRSAPGMSKEASPVPKFPRRQYLFLEDKRYVHDEMFNSEHETLTTLHNWIELSSVGRGFVNIPNAGSFNLSAPYMQSPPHSNDEIPVYMMSAFHQLHCLSYLAEHYVPVKDKEIQHHSAHCFDYLRQSIQCAADSNLEGETETGPGWGSVHTCADWDAVLAWANERTVSRWKGNLPDESTL